MAKSRTQITPVPLLGGLDLVSAPMAMAPGSCFVLHNYSIEADILDDDNPNTPYQRINGYVRFDGHPDPISQSYYVLKFKEHDKTPLPNWQVGMKMVGTQSGAEGEVLLQDGLYVVLINLRGQFTPDDTVQAHAIDAVYLNNSGQHVTVTQQYRREVRNHFRQFIKPVPGSGPIRGVVRFQNTVYAWRDNVTADETIMWGSTSDGWDPVPVQPPRVYVPPYNYNYLIFAGQAGDETTGTFKSGYFRTGAWYGELLIPKQQAAADRFKSLYYFYPDESKTKLVLDPGEHLGDLWEVQVYVNDVLAYRFNGDIPASDAEIHNPVGGDTAYRIDINGHHELWQEHDRVGLRLRLMTDKPGPETDVWTLAAPGSVAEGSTWTVRIHAVNDQGLPAPNRVYNWWLEGVQPEDVNGPTSGSAGTDINGDSQVNIDFEVDGLSEREQATFFLRTPAQHEHSVSTLVEDSQLPAGSHTYQILGPSQVTRGEPAVFTFKVVNLPGELVSGQDIDYIFDNVLPSDIDGEASAVLTTDDTGTASTTVTVKLTSAIENYTVRMRSPITLTKSVTVKPEEIIEPDPDLGPDEGDSPEPPGDIKGPTSEGSYWTLSRDRSWVSPDAGVLYTVRSYLGPTGIRRPNTSFTIQLRRLWGKFGTTDTKTVSFSGETDENGELKILLEVPSSFCQPKTQVVAPYTYRIWPYLSVRVSAPSGSTLRNPVLTFSSLQTRQQANEPHVGQNWETL